MADKINYVRDGINIDDGKYTCIVKQDDVITEQFDGNSIRYFNGEVIYTDKNLQSYRFPAKAYERKVWKYMAYVLPMALVQLQKSFGLILGNIMLEINLEEDKRYVPRVTCFNPEHMKEKIIHFKVFPSMKTLEIHVKQFLKLGKLDKYQNSSEILKLLNKLIFSLSEGNAKLIVDILHPIFSGKITRNRNGHKSLRKISLLT